MFTFLFYKTRIPYIFCFYAFLIIRTSLLIVIKKTENHFQAKFFNSLFLYRAESSVRFYYLFEHSNVSFKLKCWCKQKIICFTYICKYSSCISICIIFFCDSCSQFHRSKSEKVSCTTMHVKYVKIKQQ